MEQSLTSAGELPALFDDGLWIGGFANIINYFAQKGYDLDTHFSEFERSRITAYTSLLHGTAFDLSLLYQYIDKENWEKSTRKTWGKILPFPLQYWIPLQKYDLAKARLERRFGDLLFEEAESSFYPSMTRSSQTQKRVLEEARARTRSIRIHEVATGLYKSLLGLLGESRYILGARPCSLDCVVFGHLAFHLYLTREVVPNPYLANFIRQDAPRLAGYLNLVRDTFVPEGVEISLGPQASIFSGVTHSSTILLQSLRSAIPFVSQSNNLSERDKPKEVTRRNWKDIGSKAAFLAGGIVGMMLFVFANGIVQFETEDDMQAQGQEAEEGGYDQEAEELEEDEEQDDEDDAEEGFTDEFVDDDIDEDELFEEQDEE